MKKIFWICLCFFSITPLWATTDEGLMNKDQNRDNIINTLKNGELLDALLLIDDFYTLLEPDRPPFEFHGNSLLNEAVGKHVQNSGLQAVDELKLLSEKLKTPQAQVELYSAYGKFEQRRIFRRPLPETYEQHINLLRNNIGEKIAAVEVASEPQSNSIEEISSLQASIGKTESQKSRPRLHPAARYWEVMEQYMALSETPDWIKPYIIISAAIQYMRYPVLSSQDCQAALAILNTPLNSIPPPAVTDELIYLRVVAFLGLDRGEEALTLVEKYLKPNAEVNSQILGRYLLWRGRILLQLKKIAEADAAAEELTKLNITEEPLASQISAFITDLSSLTTR